MESNGIKVLVADDHSVVRDGIKKVIKSNYSNVQFGEASCATEILQFIQKSDWNLVMVDINMPGRNGLEVLKEIKEIHPEIPVIIFSMYPEDQFAVRSIKAGASAYLSKDISSDELAKAISFVLKGGTYFTPSLTELLAYEIRHGQEKPIHEALSDREYHVFLLIATGKNVSAIANELSLSVKTISVYRANILKKMNLKNNSEITYYAFKHNLVG